MGNLTFPILRLLADGRFRSGEAIARHFKVSRTSIWNALQEAETLGVEIFSVRGKGYRLPEQITLLDKNIILNQFHYLQQCKLQQCKQQNVAVDLQIHDQLESTNGFLMGAASQGAVHATCVAANLQTQGRGRRGRIWQARLGASLTFSLLWRFQSGASALSGLSLAVGVALVRALHSLGIPEVKLKWPNDLLVHDLEQYRKLAGILIELQGDMDGNSAAVIGIGVNLRLSEPLQQQIDQPVADLASITGVQVDPNLLLGVLLNDLTNVLCEFERDGFDSLREEWMQHHAFHQQTVRLLLPNGEEIQGEINGIAADGVLLVQTAAGLQRFSAGEISLRGI